MTLEPFNDSAILFLPKIFYRIAQKLPDHCYTYIFFPTFSTLSPTFQINLHKTYVTAEIIREKIIKYLLVKKKCSSQTRGGACLVPWVVPSAGVKHLEGSAPA